MQNVIKCSFCQKPQGMVRDEAANSRTLTVSICHDCLNVCRGILKKEIKPSAESVRHRISSPHQDRVGPLCCSFCDTPQQIVGKLIGSPPSMKATYICDKCVAASDATVERQTGQVGSPKSLWHWIARRFGIHNSLLRHATKLNRIHDVPWQTDRRHLQMIFVGPMAAVKQHTGLLGSE
jgi:ATP-dependent protease Clp ATPase subunit